jgi:hypothetical protein
MLVVALRSPRTGSQDGTDLAEFRLAGAVPPLNP